MLTKRLIAFVLNIMMLITVGCDLFPDEKVIDLAITTDKSTYLLDSAAVITAIVENNSEEPVYYICTCQIHLEELENNQVTGSWMVHGFEECLSAMPIAVNHTDTFTIDLYQQYDAGFLEDFRFNTTVIYRLKLDIFEDGLFEELIDDGIRTSNNFSVTVE